MKEFNLELAKAGHPVCTRDGRNARVIFWEAKGDYPIIALITLSGGSEDHVSYTINGKFSIVEQDGLDLMMVSVKHEGWVNIYLDGGWFGTSVKVYPTKEGAIKEAINDKIYIGTTKIEWEE